ncbi:MAG: hypothetical protein U5K69_09305 [Balneolaceae bacterium]|nr:hypothetical protein [Balneolaceae bacterium]
MQAYSITLTAQLAHAQVCRHSASAAMLNGPTGISYKAWVSQDIAVAGGVSFNISEISSSFYTHVDVLKHPSVEEGSFRIESGKMLTYYGAGLRLNFDDLTDNTDIGLRIPLGSTYHFEESPTDIFFELAPTIIFDDFNFGFNGAIGFRYFLN